MSSTIGDFTLDMSIAVRVEQSAWDFYDDPWGSMGKIEYQEFEVSKGILGRNYENPKMAENHQRMLASLGYVIH